MMKRTTRAKMTLKLNIFFLIVVMEKVDVDDDVEDDLEDVEDDLEDVEDDVDVDDVDGGG